MAGLRSGRAKRKEKKVDVNTPPPGSLSMSPIKTGNSLEKMRAPGHATLNCGRILGKLSLKLMLWIGGFVPRFSGD